MSLDQRSCVAILYGGDLGASFGRLLKTRTHLRVVTTCQHRSTETLQRARAAGVEILDSLSEVLQNASIIVSLVLPEAAVEVANQCAEHKQLISPDCMYVDMNSIGLDTVEAIAKVLDNVSIPFVDAAIHGGAAHLGEQGVIYLSGRQASKVESVFAPAIRTKIIGPTIGDASKLKMLIAGISKGLSVLFAEIASISYKCEMLDAFEVEFRSFYPSIATAIDRMLPTYPEHAIRRVAELENVSDLGENVGIDSLIVRSATRQLRNFAEPLHQTWKGRGDKPLREIVALIAEILSESTLLKKNEEPNHELQ